MFEDLIKNTVILPLPFQVCEEDPNASSNSTIFHGGLEPSCGDLEPEELPSGNVNALRTQWEMCAKNTG